MSPPKNQKRQSKRPELLYVPDVVVVHPAASSKHHGDDATVKTMHSRLTNLSNDKGETNRNKFEGQPVAKYFGKKGSLDRSKTIFGIVIQGKTCTALNMTTVIEKMFQKAN